MEVDHSRKGARGKRRFTIHGRKIVFQLRMSEEERERLRKLSDDSKMSQSAYLLWSAGIREIGDVI